MSNEGKTHHRKAFNSPYLSSADIVGTPTFTIKRASLDRDMTKKTKELFNTIYFVEKELRPGEELKPMILNATNSKTVTKLSGSPFLDDWNDIRVTIYVDNNVKFGKEVMDGLRISPTKPKAIEKAWLDPSSTVIWNKALASLKEYGNLDKVLKSMNITQENIKALEEAAGVEIVVA